MTRQESAMREAIRQHIEVPAYIAACADAVSCDLFNGPMLALIPGGDVKRFDADMCDGCSGGWPPLWRLRTARGRLLRGRWCAECVWQREAEANS